jgi:ankyrin repeat protein
MQLLLHLEAGKLPLALTILKDPNNSLNLGVRNDGGNTALHIAAGYGLSEVAELVISQRRESLNERSGTQNCTALHLASARGHAATVRVLLRSGADVTLLDALGRLASSVARDLATQQAFAEAVEPVGILGGCKDVLFY